MALMRLIDQTKQLGVDFSTVSATLNKIAEISSDLYNVHKKFNGTVKSHKWDRMQDVYAAINQSMVTWEKSLRKQVETMQNYMMKSFKYSLKEFESFNEVVKLRNTAGQEYFKSWVELENRKEKLFLAGEVQKWEIDFKEVKLTPDDVLKNKKVAKMLMLPQVDCFRAANDES
jgi:ribosome-associated translation inhibitor RaiA